MSQPTARSAADHEERVVCAVLAAQVAALRDRLESGSAVARLWDASDSLARLANEQTPCPVPTDPQRASRCDVTVAAVAGLSGTLENVAFVQSQLFDLARQMADCVVTALERLAVSDAPPGARLPLDDLAALYVSEDQRLVHEAVANRFRKSEAP